MLNFKRLLSAIGSVAILGCVGGCGGGGAGEAADPDDYRFFDDACLVNADCGAGLGCELGTCISLCAETSECADDETCSQRGRCMPKDAEEVDVHLFLPTGRAAHLDGSTTPLEGSQSHNLLTNMTDRPLRYRLSTNNPAATVQATPAVVPPGETAELSVEVDPSMVEIGQRKVLVTVHTTEATLPWFVEVAQFPTGHYSAVVGFSEGSPLGETALGLNVEFHMDGTLSGQTFADESVLWPRDTVVTGTWDDASGGVTLRLADVVPAEAKGTLEPPTNPLGRDVGRDIVMTGTFDDARMEISGELTERLSGLSDTFIDVPGTFHLRLDGALRESTPTATDFTPELPVLVPAWSFPPGLDEAECVELGSTFGTPNQIPGATDENDPRVMACGACAGDPACTPDEASTCASALLDGGFNLPIEQSDGDSLAPPASEAWASCTSDAPPTYGSDGRTCLDQAAVRCAGALMRHALVESGGQEPYLEPALNQIAAEAAMGGAVGTEKLIQAMFAYKDTSGSKVWLVEKDLLDHAQARFTRPLEVMFAPGFAHILLALGKSKVRDERLGADLSRMLDLGGRSIETLVSDMRLQQRTLPGETELVRRKIAYAAAWTHLQGALMDELTRRFDVPDTLAQVQVTTESLAILDKLSDQVGTGVNPFGLSPDFVPIKLATAGTEGEVTSNYQLIRDDANLQVEFFQKKVDKAEVVLAEFAKSEYNIVNQTNTIESEYNERLTRLCGAAGDKPDTDNCGQNTGEVREAVLRLEIAAQRIRRAQLALANNDQRIAIEEDRIRELVANASDLEVTLDMLTQDIFKIEDDTTAAISAKKVTATNNECSHVWATAGFDAAQSALETTKAAAATDKPWKGITIGIAGAAQVGLILGQAGVECAHLRKQAGIDKDIATLEGTAQRDIDIVNGEIDAAIRESAIDAEVIDSKAVVRNMLLDSLELAAEVEQAAAEAELAAAQVDTAITEVWTLVAGRDRALAILATNPQNPFTNARFLRARLELGRSLLKWRELALEASYRTGRALEFELNRDVPFIETELYPARATYEIEEYLFCLDSSFNRYQDDFSDIGSQALVTELSLRDDIFGLDSPIRDRVAGEDVSPEEQFGALLVDPDNVAADGSIELTFALPLTGETLFPQSQCDDRIEAIEVQLSGEGLGDAEAGVLLSRDGLSSLRRCDSANLANAEAIVDYHLEPEGVGIQATVNEWAEDEAGMSLGYGKSFGYAGWPVSGSQWRLSIPPAVLDPRNADFDVRNLSDILIRVHHRAGTVNASGDGFNPTCG